MQPPYESQLSGQRLFIVQKANKGPEPPFPGGLLRRLKRYAKVAPAEGRAIWLFLSSADTWFKAGRFPRTEQTGRAPPRFQQSQRSAVSTCAKTVSREKTQNVVDLFASCLFVVVMFRAAHNRVSLRSGHPERYTKAS